MPDFIDTFFNKRKERPEVYISLYIDIHSIAVSFWSMGGEGGRLQLLASESSGNVEDSWQSKSDAIDRLIGLLEERTKITDETKVILGLPSIYLTPTGEIQKEIQKEIRELTKILELNPIGFVPLNQAIIFKLKREEGVPPSVILLGMNNSSIAISIYKIGTLAGFREIEKNEDIAASVESGLKSFTDLEVLPARVLLYGSDVSSLEGIKSDLLRHSWTNKVNFLHFPKIEVMSNTFVIDAISLAGASELGAAVESIEEAPAEAAAQAPVQTEASEPFVTPDHNPVVELPVEEEIAPEEENDEAIEDAITEDAKEESPLDEEKDMAEEVIEAQEAVREDLSTESEATQDANVVMVDAESLGFKKDVDVLEEENQMEQVRQEQGEEEREKETGEPRKTPVALPRIDFGRMLRIFRMFSSRFMAGRSPMVPIILGVVVLCVIAGIFYWTLPHAVLTILEIPRPVDLSQAITIDPSATTVDAQNNIIPGRTQQKLVTGEKTVPVNGKKDIGDPAKGTITIYNKSSDSPLTLSKGTVLSTGGLQYTLDNDVSVASATSVESPTGINTTFTTADVAATAVAIGPQSNIPASSEFTIKNVSSDTAVGRNAQPFAGGTSKQVTVVTRADYDSFVTNESQELVGNAKQDLSGSVGGNIKLIDDTIKTTVTEKVFGQEIDQEATQLQGKLTISITGVGYSDSDIQALLSTLAADKVPAGYVINESKTTITLSNVRVLKNGKITATANMSAVALPTIDTASIRNNIAGKSIKDVETYLRTVTGIAGVTVTFRLSPSHARLPINKNNISVTTAVSQ